MELPRIELPQVIVESIPMDQLPALMHPPLVHFAVVLPIMIVILEIVHIILKRDETPEVPKGRGVSALSLILTLAVVAIFFGAYISGSVDGKATFDLLSEEGQKELSGHKTLGTYLVYGSFLLLFFKLIALVAGKRGRTLFLFIALLFALLTLKQGKDGGELVYEHGANVAKVKELDDRVFDLEDELETIKSAIASKNAEAPQPVQPAANPPQGSGVEQNLSTEAVAPTPTPAAEPTQSVTETNGTLKTEPNPVGMAQ